MKKISNRYGFSLVEILIAVSILSVIIIGTMQWGTYLNRGVSHSKAVSDRDRVLENVADRIRNLGDLNTTYQTLLAANPAHPFVRCLNPNPAAGTDCPHMTGGELPIYRSTTGALVIGTQTNLGNAQLPGPVGYSLNGGQCAPGTVACPLVAFAAYTALCQGNVPNCAQAADFVFNVWVDQTNAFDRIPSALRRLGMRQSQTTVRANDIIATTPNAVCPPGQYVQSINPDRSANCAALPPPQIAGCNPGEYMEALVPPDGMTARCHPVPQGACGPGNALRGITYTAAGFNVNCTALPQASCPAGQVIQSFNWDGTRVCVPLGAPPAAGHRVCPADTTLVGVDFTNGRAQCIRNYEYVYSNDNITQVPGVTGYISVPLRPNRPLVRMEVTCPVNYSPLGVNMNVGSTGIIHDISFDYPARKISVVFGCVVNSSITECLPVVLDGICILHSPGAQAALVGGGWF